MSTLNDPRLEFIQSIDKASLKFTHTSSPLVLLCGGPVPLPKENADDKDPAIVSLRQLVELESITFTLNKGVSKFNLFLPEFIQEWGFDALFKNLMDYEKELASVSSLVIIILESAGSIAELGAFTQLPELSEKLIVIKSLDYGDENSFIDLGILRYLRSNNGDHRVKKYNWLPKTKQGEAKIDNDIADHVLQDINEELNKIKKNPKFNEEVDTHITTLICEILSIFIVLKEKELFTYLVQLEIDINRDRLKRKLFILNKFEILSIKEIGDAKFYYRTTEAFHAINGFSSKCGPIDKLRLQTSVSEYYIKKNERHRIAAMKQKGHQNV
jgi:hypothetical protein